LPIANTLPVTIFQSHGSKTIGTSGVPSNHRELVPNALDMIAPFPKSLIREASRYQISHNTTINSIRINVEPAIVNLKTWKIPITNRRRHYRSHPDTIPAVTRLAFHSISSA
jgi:hypothetical protein